MEQFKRVKVIMLPTENKINSLKGYKDNSLLFQFKERYRTIEAEKPYVSNYHLYIISDDEIKEGDWFISEKYSKPIQYPKYGTENQGNMKKIIATTDTSLTIQDTLNQNKIHYLSQPSQQFIEKYIESYNKGEVITDVLVEYENNYDLHYYTPPGGIECCEKINNWKLKINPKDSTITIKKVKDSWNKEELQPLKDYYEHSKQFVRSNDYREQDVQKIFKWIEENL